MTADETAPELSDPADLYTLPLDQFTAARDRLADRLRAEDRKEEATEVGRLRKPSVAAWALNRVARYQPEKVRQLLEAHRRLRAADTMEAMQEAAKRRTNAVAGLTSAALEELAAEGRPASAQTRDRVTSTLLAVATDPDGEGQLESGRLVRELEPSGGGWGEVGLSPPPQVDPGRGALVAAEEARNRAERLDKEAAEAERRLEIAKRAVTEARRRAKEARSRAEQAAEEARQAEGVAREMGAG